MVAKVDLDAYFQRIHWSGSSDPTLETLAGLIKAHTAHIPFENLDICSAARSVSTLRVFRTRLSVPAVAVIVSNTPACLRPCLKSLDFQVARHAARVVLFGPLAEAKRDHMFMTVVVGGATYVVDPGFGPYAPRFPVPLVASSPGQTTHWMQRDGNFWVLHVTREDRQPVAGWASTLEVENPLVSKCSTTI